MQSPFENDFFELFSLDRRFSIDLVILRERFQELQKKFHPDNFASASEQDRRLSAQYASLINEAYSTLRDPALRGRYMLSLLGVSTDEEHDTSMDPGFLMQQIELREQLETAQSNLEALAKLADDVALEYSKRVEKIAEILDKQNNSELDNARHLVRELQFLNRMRNEIEKAEETFF